MKEKSNFINIFLVIKRWSSERHMRVMISEFHERKFFDLFVSIFPFSSTVKEIDCDTYV